MKSTLISKEKAKYRLEFSASDIVKALKAYGFIDKDIEVKEIYVPVPGGGDYSGMNLDIDTFCPLVLTVEK